MSNDSSVVFEGISIVSGEASGEVLSSDTAISLLLGVDVTTGEVIDATHPLRGSVLAGKIVVVPSGRGSCSGSGALLEMILAGTAPAALVFCQEETILTLGSVIADEFFGRKVPVVRLSDEDHRLLRSAQSALVADGRVVSNPARDQVIDLPACGVREEVSVQRAFEGVRMSLEDEAVLRGERGEAPQRAMREVGGQRS